MHVKWSAWGMVWQLGVTAVASSASEPAGKLLQHSALVSPSLSRE